jgi:signal peptidase II
MLYIAFGIILFAAAADQITKLLIFGHDCAVIPGLFKFASVENHGMVWGLANGVSGLMIVVSIVTAAVIAVMIWLLVKYRKVMGAPIAIALAAVIGGAIGNLIDRVALGYVRDFICTEFIDFPVFNTADIFVTLGAIALGVLIILTKKGHALMAAIFPEDSADKKKK